MECLSDTEILKRVVKDKTKARVHVVPMKDLNYGALAKVLKDLGQTFDNVLTHRTGVSTASTKDTANQEH